MSNKVFSVQITNTPSAIHLLPLFHWAVSGAHWCSCPHVSFVPPSFLKGPDGVVSVPALLAGIPSLHRDAAGEASVSVSAGASKSRSGSTARSGPGAVGAVLGPVHRKKLLYQQHHQGEVMETPSTCPRTQHHQGITDGFHQFASISQGFYKLPNLHGIST